MTYSAEPGATKWRSRPPICYPLANGHNLDKTLSNTWRKTVLPLPLAFKTFRTVRFHMLREIDGLTEEQFLAIPEGRGDNILWNMGHALCSISRLAYRRSGFPLPIPEAYLELFGKGTAATDWKGPPDVQEVTQRFKDVPEEIELDYKAGKFEHYDPLELAPGHTIESVEEAVSFHCFHEGLHIGVIITLKQMLGFGNGA